MSKNTGVKIHNNSTIENMVIGWLVSNPSISDYEIAKRLTEKDFKVSAHLVKGWKEHFYLSQKKELINKVKSGELESEEPLFTEIDKISNFKDFIRYKKDLTEVYQILVSKVREKALNEDGSINIFYNKDDYTLIKDYISTLSMLTDKIDRLIGTVNIYKILEEVIEKLLEYVAITFPYDGNEKEYGSLKDHIKSYEKELRERYSIG